MEERVDTTILGYIGTTRRIHSFSPSQPKARLSLRILVPEPACVSTFSRSLTNSQLPVYTFVQVASLAFREQMAQGFSYPVQVAASLLASARVQAAQVELTGTRTIAIF